MYSRPRILVLSTAYLPLIGGSELAIHHIAQQLEGYDFDLITKRYSDDAPAVEQLGRIRVFRVRSPKILLPLAIAYTAFRLSLRHSYVLIHAYQASQAAGGAWLVKFFKCRTPLIITIQEGKNLEHQHFMTRGIRSVILRRADAVTAISEYLAAFARRHTDAPVSVIPNGVLIRDIVHVENPDPTILTVSRLVPKNNVEAVIRAFAIVRRSVTNARLAIVGDGPLRPKLEELANQLGVREATDFRGTVPHDQLGIVYAAADVFVRPSLSEGLGSVFLEAMAARVPVVASFVGGIPDIVHDRQTGLVCDPRKPDDIARRIVTLLQDRPLRDAIVERADRMVREQYDWKIIAAQMDTVYRHTIAR